MGLKASLSKPFARAAMVELRTKSAQPANAQLKQLNEIVKTAEKTLFGKDHGLRDGMSIEEVAKKRETSVGEGRKGEIANVLEHSSVGKQEHVWEELQRNEKNVRVIFIYGALDEKFASIAEKAVRVSNNVVEAIEIDNAGHAVHLEQPCLVVMELANLLNC